MRHQVPCFLDKCCTYFEQIPFLPIINTIHLSSALVEVLVVLYITIK